MVDMEKNIDRFMDVNELAAFLAVPCSWIYQHTSDGDIPYMKVGRYVRFWLPDVLAWLGSYTR